MGKRTYYTHTETVDVSIRIADVLEEASTEDLLAELHSRAARGEVAIRDVPDMRAQVLETLRELTRAASDGDQLHASVMEARLRSMILPARPN